MDKYLRTSIHSPIDCISVGQFISNESWRHVKRTIDSYEVIIGVDEILYMEVDGTPYEVKPGDILFIQPDTVHSGYSNSKSGVSFYWFHFYCNTQIEEIDGEMMDDLVKELRANPHLNGTNSNIFLPIYSTPSQIERINILFNQLLDVATANYYNNHAIDYLATSLLIELSEQTVTNFQTSFERTDTDKKLATIMEWIRINAMGNISVHSIAEKFNYNKDYLTRIFKKKVGMNIQEYIHILKIAKAKDLLSRTDTSVKRIASIVGINDEKYFMRLFKRYVKLTPTEFRKAYYRKQLNNE
ncbi:AraC family transcriptional regulator [Lederbergia sp. NSJ-179]|uniref:helix-turn-helix domain-containing protein n=1 Tax=Lederbergia sp. NSJ-179 TaxID=2931402 RepID=UPI001FD15D1C|nr:AraC family transcriptional regulator [Lederbergia sp. NSJ-179]MCJ7843234.1 AraC family transcriptional regulator [Lederbergia sp. NSJ-179]